jgi:hypothetical protein
VKRTRVLLKKEKALKLEGDMQYLAAFHPPSLMLLHCPDTFCWNREEVDN